MTRRWIATAVTVVVIGVVVYLLANGAIHIPGLFPAPPSIEDLEQEAEEAGNQAAEEKQRELDAETDAEVAAGSAVVEQHAADADERHTTDADAEQRALDDLHRRLHEHLLAHGRPGEDDVQREVVTDADVDALLGHMRDRLLGRAAQSDAPDGDGVRPQRHPGSL